MAKDKFDILNQNKKEDGIINEASLKENRAPDQEEFIKPFPVSKFSKKFDDAIKATGVPRNTYIKLAVEEKLTRDGKI